MRLGFAAIGYTINPGPNGISKVMVLIRGLLGGGQAAGIATMIWSYPRNGDIVSTAD